eukprot:m.92406 g.92406  ORF g.92406 m.92406 type:complete len:872 (-) comp14943_c0_seq1:56-2671(-)
MMADKPSADDDGFQELEADFKAVLDQLQADPALSRFRGEYEKIHDALHKSHDNEKRLMSKCRELNAELVASAAKVQSSLQGDRQEESSMTQLKTEVDEAWKMVDSARANESRLKEESEALREEILLLNQQLEDVNAEAEGHNETVQAAVAARREAEVERDNLAEQVVKATRDISELQEAQTDLEAQLVEIQARSDQTEEQLQAKRVEAEREQRRKAHLEREINVQKQAISAKESSIADIEGALSKAQNEKTEIALQLKQKEDEVAKAEEDLASLQRKNAKLEKQIDEGLQANQAAFEETARLKRGVKTKEEEYSQAQQEAVRLHKLNDAVQRKLRASEEARVQTTEQRDQARTEAAGLTRELEALKKQVEADRKRLDELARTRDQLSKKMLQAGKETEVQEALVKMHDNAAKSLETEIAGYREEASKQRKAISALEKERDRYINEATAAQRKAIEAAEEVGVAERQTADMKKKLVDAEANLRQQQALFEQARNDRNVYSKNLVEAQDEIGDMKRKLKVLSHQIDQLKEEINAKEGQLQREHQHFDTLENQKVKLKQELDNLKLSFSKSQDDIQAQQADHEKLRRILTQTEAEREKQVKELDKVIAERDTLGTQLIRRNDELALVYEKLRIQQTTLSKGESQYRERMEDIRLLKLEIKRLRRERQMLSKSTSSVDDLRRELFQVQRELLRERTRCKALEEEVQTPLNVHRWRRLEGSDPNAYEMIQKVQTLQKRLIAKTEEVVEKELRIQEMEKQYLELKAVLARQPGPEVSEQLQIYQQAVKDKNKQLKAMASELNMYQAQVNEYKYEVDRMSRELQDVKKKYFEIKKKEMLQKEKERTLPPVSLASSTRFAGGGYNLNPPAKLSTELSHA